MGSGEFRSFFVDTRRKPGEILVEKQYAFQIIGAVAGLHVEKIHGVLIQSCTDIAKIQGRNKKDNFNAEYEKHGEQDRPKNCFFFLSFFHCHSPVRVSWSTKVESVESVF